MYFVAYSNYHVKAIQMEETIVLHQLQSDLSVTYWDFFWK